MAEYISKIMYEAHTFLAHSPIHIYLYMHFVFVNVKRMQNQGGHVKIVCKNIAQNGALLMPTYGGLEFHTH